MTGPRRLLCALLCASLIATAALTAQGGEAEATDAAGVARNQMFEELAREVAALQVHGSLLKKVVRLARPSVVHIEAEKSLPSLHRQRHEEAGSGVIIELGARKYVLTNRHVIRDAALPDIRIQLADGHTIHPTHVWEDPKTDVAVLAVSEENLTSARVAEHQPVEIGDFVLAVGSPFGLSHSVTYGIISAKGRRDLELGDGSIRYQNFLQTDAAINPGNSGGPLLNLRGEVIGINTAIASSSGGSEGIGFTIPIQMVMTVARQLVEYGHTVPAYLGVQLNDDFGPNDAVRLGVPRPQGAQITRVNPNTPAERAELKANDVVIEFDGQRIEDDEHLINVVGFTPVGKKVEILVFRKGEVVRLQVKVDQRTKYEPER
ncbi:MAG: S1C family serine protease [Pirellulaceae bacterium]